MQDLWELLELKQQTESGRKAVLLSLGSPDVLGLQLPEILTSTVSREGLLGGFVQEPLGT